MKWSFDAEEIWKVTLGSQYSVSASSGSQSVSGTWTMMYDQALIVELDNGMRFVVYFRYNITPRISKDPLVDGFALFNKEISKSRDYASFDSDCS